MPAPDYATEIAALEAGLAASELTIESDGDRVTYKSASDMLKALNYYRSKAASAAGSRRGGSSVAVYNGD